MVAVSQSANARTWNVRSVPLWVLDFPAIRFRSQCSKFPRTQREDAANLELYEILKPRNAAPHGNTGLKHTERLSRRQNRTLEHSCGELGIAGQPACCASEHT